MQSLIAPALVAFALSTLFLPPIIWLARRYGIVDKPGGRRIHTRIVPRLGGVAIVAAFFGTFLYYLPEIAPYFKEKQLLGFALASLLLVFVGVLDDRRGVRPGFQLAAHIACGLVLVLVGMGIEEITNPFGGKLNLEMLNIPISIGGVPHYLSLPADILTVLWVVLVINSANWIDGLDGLAAGVGTISAVTLALLSLSATVGQQHVALLAMILAGALLGFLLYNFHPAKVFLGTVGSTFIGFTIATLAIISGGKVATAVLVLGFPILDALSLIVRRYLGGRAVWQADAKHLHHLLLAHGFSVPQTAVLIYILSAIFGGLALVAGTTGQKALAFVALAVVMLTVLWWASRPVKKR